jgi:tRNA (guanine-N7-)-methyltransferase
VRGYGERVQQLFGPRELQGVYILFPDPWPKKAQRKHRMIEPRFLRKLYEVLADGGSLHIRTDDSSYFNWILNSFQSVKDCFRIEGLSWNLYEQEFFADLSVRSLQKTLFEKIWIDEGKSIHALTAKKLING